MSGMSAAYAANEDSEAQRQARRERAVTVQPGPEEQALDRVLAGDAAGWGPEALSALRVRAGHERSHREHQARKGE